MGGCCHGAAGNGSEHENFKTGGDKDLSHGPILKRRCTDVCCTCLFLVHWVAFLVITFVGARHGDPRKLFRPRDFQGGYCGMGPDFSNHKKQVQMMNTSVMVEPVLQQLVCSTAVQGILQPMMMAADYNEYLCSCCLIPCDTCGGALGISDIQNPSDVQGTITVGMAALTDPTMGVSLFTGAAGGANAIDPANIFAQMTKYFIPVCFLQTCALPGTNTTNGTMGPNARNWTYSPDPDSPFRKAWDMLTDNTSVPATIRYAIDNVFTFKALPFAYCPYAERYCIPMPGTNFTEFPNDYCIPKLDSSVQSALGSDAANLLQGLGESSVAETGSEGLGAMAGQVLATADALVIVTFWSFVVGLIFMVLMRFFVGCFVWSALVLVLAFLVFGGIVAMIRSNQCAGADLFESGREASVAVTVAAATVVSTALGAAACSEKMTGDGEDYRGCQTRTKSGKLCQSWSSSTPHNHTWTPENYPNSGLADNNYCRNPANATTIWCMTTDTDQPWELCSPIGLVAPSCANGYAVATQYARDGLKICAGIIWGLAGVWVLIVIFLHSRINLAISINKVAAVFIYNTPSVLLVPIFQITASVCYTILWAVSACYLLSQIPDAYTSKDSYATWADAMGTPTKAGACNPKWPAGYAYKYSGNLNSTNDTCSGDMGNITGMTPKCWKCSPPRYAFDWYFAYSFFSYLWNNAFLLALGQVILAGSVGVWFFTRKEEKGKKSPILQSVKIALRYHLGSIAFGSFIIAVIEFVRYVLYYMQQQAAAQKNRIMVLVLKVIQCCLWCFEKCMKFLNKNAYIQIALLGTNFCTSAKNAFFLILRNAARFATMLMLGSIIRFVGGAAIIVVATLVGYFVLQLLHPRADPVMPMLLFLAISYMVAKLFMLVFGLAVDTCLQCFIAAEEQKLDADCVPGPLKSMFHHHADASQGQENLNATLGKDSRVAPAPSGAEEAKP